MPGVNNAGKSSDLGHIQDVLLKIAGSLNLKDKKAEPRSASSFTPPDDALQHVLDTSRKELHAETCALFLVDNSRRSLMLEKISGRIEYEKLKDVGNYSLTGNPGEGEGVTPWVLSAKKPFNARNFEELKTRSEGHWKGNWDKPMYGEKQAENLFECVYMVPLIAGDNAIGVLKYENRTPGFEKRYFGAEDEHIIDTVAILVTNIILSQRIERSQYDEILPAISKTLVDHLDKATFYDELLEKCCNILNAEFCSLFLLDNNRNLMLKSIAGINAEKKGLLKGFGYPDYTKSGGLTPWILIKETPFNVRSYPDLRDKSEGKHMGKWDEIIYDGVPKQKFRSLYSTPLIIGNEKIGVFKVENKKIPPYYFTESDAQLFDLIGRLIAVGVKYWKAQNEANLGQMVRAAELGFLAAGISHEFNNYLAKIMFLCEVIKVEDRKQTKKDIKTIYDQCVQANKFIMDFRSIAKREDKIKEFDMEDLIKQVINISRQRCIDYTIRITTRNENESVTRVVFPPSHIQSIIINLINNAIEAISENKEKTSGSIEIVTYYDGEHLTIEVNDNGKGINPEDQQIIFAPFYTTKPTGMGIGLFWVRQLVSELGGEIKVTSPYKDWSTSFRIKLPVVKGEKNEDIFC